MVADVSNHAVGNGDRPRCPVFTFHNRVRVRVRQTRVCICNVDPEPRGYDAMQTGAELKR